MLPVTAVVRYTHAHVARSRTAARVHAKRITHHAGIARTGNADGARQKSSPYRVIMPGGFADFSETASNFNI